jgi:hypothetical protein
MSATTKTIINLQAEAHHAARRGNRPRVHGNGFVQLDLSPTRRLHVWGDPRVPRQLVPTTIHDHTFSFRSIVCRGQLVHREIDVRPGLAGAYEMYYAVTNHGEDTRLVRNGARYHATIAAEHLLREGDEYTFEKFRFHETVAPWLCVTVIEKDGPTLAQGGPSPNVLVPFGWEPDNTFDRYQTDADLLWQIVDEALS